MTRNWMAAAALALGVALPHAGAQKLAKPVRLEAGGQPINVGGVGHSAPFLADIDGDGKVHLMVGTFEGGQLRIYRNVGSNREPRFDAKYDMLLDGKPDGTVPSG